MTEVHRDDVVPYYTVRFATGQERQTVRGKLRVSGLSVGGGGTPEHGEGHTERCDGAAADSVALHSLRCPVRHMNLAESPSPIAKRELAVAALAQRLRPRFVLPLSSEHQMHDGVHLPCKHCAFIGCAAEGPDNQWLEEHLATCHLEEFAGLDEACRSIEDPNDDECKVCGRGEDLVCCSTCPASYHLRCLNLTARDVAGHGWSCPLEGCASEKFGATVCALLKNCERSPVSGWFTANYLAMYTLAVHHRARLGVSYVGLTLDRRHETAFKKALCDKNLHALICFCCARVLPSDASDSAREIRMVSSGELFKSMGAATLEELLGVRTYLAAYGHDAGIQDSELRDWVVEVELEGGDSVPVICCPEDRSCEWCDAGRNGAMCPDCKVPVCRDCRRSLRKSKPSQPRMSLANDLFTGSPPSRPACIHPFFCCAHFASHLLPNQTYVSLRPA